MSVTALTTVLAKFAGLHVAAKAGVGLAVAAGAVGAAAGTPVVIEELTGPQDVQVAPAATVSPSSESTAEATAEASAAPTDTATEPTGAPTVAPSGDPTTSWQDAETFGAWVSQDARDGGVDGQEISAAARERAALRHSGGEQTAAPVPTAEPTSEADVPAEDAPEVEPPVEAPDAGAAEVVSRGNGAAAPGRDK
ncbi:hypothetical protein ACTHAM_000766 [Cellulomonas soli]|uniref:hypothetical protein n=1 Tax=Cellulomonas soli TaxID=931535 RepID=UPI003F877C55